MRIVRSDLPLRLFFPALPALLATDFLDQVKSSYQQQRKKEEVENRHHGRSVRSGLDSCVPKGEIKNLHFTHLDLF